MELGRESLTAVEDLESCKALGVMRNQAKHTCLSTGNPHPHRFSPLEALHI